MRLIRCSLLVLLAACDDLCTACPSQLQLRGTWVPGMNGRPNRQQLAHDQAPTATLLDVCRLRGGGRLQRAGRRHSRRVGVDDPYLEVGNREPSKGGDRGGHAGAQETSVRTAAPGIEGVAFPNGTIVSICGLSGHADLNGREAKVLFFNEHKGRFAVRLREQGHGAGGEGRERGVCHAGGKGGLGGKPLLIKAGNLQLVGKSQSTEARAHALSGVQAQSRSSEDHTEGQTEKMASKAAPTPSRMPFQVPIAVDAEPLAGQRRTKERRAPAMRRSRLVAACFQLVKTLLTTLTMALLLALRACFATVLLPLSFLFRLRWVLLSMMIQMITSRLYTMAEEALSFAASTFLEARSELGASILLASWYATGAFAYALCFMCRGTVAALWPVTGPIMNADTPHRSYRNPTRHRGYQVLYRRPPPLEGVARSVPEGTIEMQGLRLSDFLQAEADRGSAVDE
jgi:hypothetical protein